MTSKSRSGGEHFISRECVEDWATVRDHHDLKTSHTPYPLVSNRVSRISESQSFLIASSRPLRRVSAKTSTTVSLVVSKVGLKNGCFLYFFAWSPNSTNIP